MLNNPEILRKIWFRAGKGISREGISSQEQWKCVEENEIKISK